MATFIKKGRSEVAMAEIDQEIKTIVSGIIKDIEQGGDATIKELSKKFDNWCPDTFRLSNNQIQDIVNSVPQQVISDIQFAQKQIKNFAQNQRASIVDMVVETLPGVFLGHKNIPVNSAGCYIPGGRYPMVASAHMSILTAKVVGVKRVIACTPY